MKDDITIPTKLTTLAPLRWGEKGVEWLESLPNLLQECSQRFGVHIGEPFENAYANYVATATHEDGNEVVVKIGFPGGEAIHEQHALIAFDGNSCVRVLHHAEDLVAIVIEKALPGTMLTSITDDSEATKIAAKLMKNLHCDVPTGYAFDTVEDIMKVFDRIGTDHEMPVNKIDKALKVYKELDTTKKEEKLLHGDLHHYNILKDDSRGWIAIDPLGVVGEPAYEVGQYYHNPYSLNEVKDPIAQSLNRAKIFAETFDCDPVRILQWGFVQCIISAAWAIEDNEDWRGSYAWAETLERVMDINS